MALFFNDSILHAMMIMAAIFQKASEEDQNMCVCIVENFLYLEIKQEIKFLMRKSVVL